MTAYVIAHVRQAKLGPELVQYLQRIDDTLTPFEGHFLVHGGNPQSLEGTWEGQVIIIAFPTREHAHTWYDSPAYRDILPLRLDHTTGETVLVDGVEPKHRATDILPAN